MNIFRYWMLRFIVFLGEKVHHRLSSASNIEVALMRKEIEQWRRKNGP